MDIETLPFVLSTAGILITALLLKEKKKRKRSKWWVRPIFRNSKTQGDNHNLINEMRLNDEEMFFRYTRRSPDQFDSLLLDHNYENILNVKKLNQDIVLL
jgi:hypothetical protein